MPVRTIVDRMIESSTHGNGGILLDGTDGSSSNAGSFLVLDASAASTVDVNERIEYEQETIAEENIESTVKSLNFDAIKLENEDGNILLDTDESNRIIYDEIFNPSTFNIGSTLTAGNAIKVDSSGSGFEFGSAGGLVKLFQGSASAASSFEINSTFINSTYDNYVMFIDATPVTDNQYLRMRFLHSDSVHTGSDYHYETTVYSSSTYTYDSDAADHVRMTYQGGGSASGEGINIFCTLTQVNTTSRPTVVKGDANITDQNGNSQCGTFAGGQDLGGRTNAITGVHIYFGSGNIIMNDFAIYGVVK
jgi:hypothetical protein